MISQKFLGFPVFLGLPSAWFWPRWSLNLGRCLRQRLSVCQRCSETDFRHFLVYPPHSHLSAVRPNTSFIQSDVTIFLAHLCLNAIVPGSEKIAHFANAN